MQIKKITGEDCKKLRSLWEEVFYEDSEQFTDYYFEHKAEKNIGYVIGDDACDAMMFRTPYEVQIGEEQRKLSYIVGVATRKECRHRGYMRTLLNHAMQEMYRDKEPFTFLMPANPAIYEPFGFRYVYEREEWSYIEEVLSEKIQALEAEEEDSELQAASIEGREEKQAIKDRDILNGIFSVSKLRKEVPQYSVMEKLAEFANRILKENFQIYVHRDIAYYEMQLKESTAQNGDIYVLLENGIIKAFFLYAKEENKVYIQEVLKEKGTDLDFLQKQEHKKPIIMARIIHLEEMMKLVRSKEEREVILKVTDELLPGNNGVFQWKITQEGSKVLRLEDNTKVSDRISIEQLAPLILKNVFLNEIV